MTKGTAGERALARAAMYRLLALAFGYPAPELTASMDEACGVAAVGAGLLDPEVFAAVEDLRLAYGRASHDEVEASYQRVFTLSYNEDCPIYESAFSANHLFQQTQHQADISGFYRAFGVDPRAERSDHIVAELEFCYLLALKEAIARERGEADHVRICRHAQRAFLRDHLARWAPLIARRVVLAGAKTVYEAAGRLLLAFVAREQRFLRLGPVELYRDEPVMIADEPGDMSCPASDLAFSELTITETKEGRHVGAGTS